MSKLPNGLTDRIALGCYAIVSDNFATFHNVNMRGPKFIWENFPEMMRSRCGTNIFLNTAIPDRHKKAAKERAEKVGLEIAKKLIELKGI